MTDFLLIYDRSKRRILEIRRFEDSSQALAAYGESEAANREDQKLEIVLLQAESEEALKRTHGQYFENSDQLFQTMITRLKAA